ncbi:ComEA family DNA-binding protein [Cellulomonas sp. NS3]|uniref:ComEA family DNA-binding protein n=1 Tax=Cellulomonas sp. NS3 TaxID=2973977 RepID=UPI00216316F5|nr:ComEA family DNA-binding protein [Cellulomonas sp. NS3]
MAGGADPDAQAEQDEMVGPDAEQNETLGPDAEQNETVGPDVSRRPGRGPTPGSGARQGPGAAWEPEPGGEPLPEPGPGWVDDPEALSGTTTRARAEGFDDGTLAGAEDVVRRVATGRLARARDEYAGRYGSPLEREHEVGAGAAARRWAVPTRLGLVAALAVALVAGVVVARAAPALVPQVGHAVELPEVTGAPGATGEVVGAEPEPDAATGADVAGGADAPTGAGTAAGSAERAGQVVVHVVGQVAQPGIIELPEGSRVSDALTAAGGPSSSADLAALNLARVLVDGEQVAVSAVGEAAPAAPAGPATDAAGSAGPLDLNTADVTALDALPGIGPVLAGRILAWREEHGRFRSLDELAEVEGIGPALLERLAPAVRV